MLTLASDHLPIVISINNPTHFAVSKFWSTVRFLSNPTRHDDRVEILFDFASYFRQQFTLHFSVDKANRRVIRRLHKLQKNSAPLYLSSSGDQVVKAITPDEVCMSMLKILSQAEVAYLSKVLNLSLATFIVPNM